VPEDPGRGMPGGYIMIDPKKITVSIYRSDYRVLIAIAIAKDLRDRKNHPSIKKAVNQVLKGCVELPFAEKRSQ
jgi:hypothetical protein